MMCYFSLLSNILNIFEIKIPCLSWDSNAGFCGLKARIWTTRPPSTQLLLCEVKFTALWYNPLLILYTPANDLEAFEFHSGVTLYWDGKFLGLQPAKAHSNIQNEYHEGFFLIFKNGRGQADSNLGYQVDDKVLPMRIQWIYQRLVERNAGHIIVLFWHTTVNFFRPMFSNLWVRYWKNKLL